MTVLSLFFTSVGFAQDTSFTVPKQTIQGADQSIALGELVDLSLSPIDKPDPNLVGKDYKWSVVEAGIGKDGQVKLTGKRVRENNDGVFFGAGIKNKDLYVNCVCVYTFVIRDKTDPSKITQISTRTVILSKQVKIGDGDTPGPIPPPDPKPNPAPNFDVGSYDLAKTAYQLANSKVSDPATRTKGAAAYARAYSGLSSEILTSGATYTLEDAIKKSTSLGSDAIRSAGVSPDSWGGFGESLQDNLYNLYTSKKISNAKDFGVALKEISNGLGVIK